MRTRSAVVAAVLLAFSAADSSRAYWTNGQRWTTDIVMHLQLGSSGGALIDGSPNWNTAAENALALWNPFLSGVSFRVIRDSTSGIAIRNGVNNVAWGKDVYGESFGDAVAVTQWLYRTSDNVFSEADVIFDTGRDWNSYRGNRRGSADGDTLYDLRRVALHEFGHVLGLGHPDDHGQSVSAVMNSQIGNVDSLLTDDTNGARAIYGSAPTRSNNRSPTVTASCSPCTIATGRSSSLRAAATDPDGDSLTYRWSASQGAFSTATVSATVWTAPNQAADVSVTITVEDGRGGTATASVGLQVIPGDTLQVDGRLLPGQWLISSNSQYRLLYQTDGNLVLYDDINRSAPWASHTGGTSAGFLVLQGDGNLVIYDAQGVARWGSGTSGSGSTSLALQNDGNLVLYRADGRAVWGRLQQ